ncbi:MAG: hypothetical protein COW63_11440 [Bacteroidetes bacterium CG18_big_fil_WC_8_21_14_2_50_41_14]|nr:MAG: hypothetical protein COW63_11440 [Bacteroidetes bacterium CG18_big_fil_WC_8_21_14_2_50_41_14]PJB56865.1 MAG: hypothetical protein CO098_12730 [Bacteroidetes bacterium CG_4_9_14_3_um_filter_41_19]
MEILSIFLLFHFNQKKNMNKFLALCILLLITFQIQAQSVSQPEPQGTDYYAQNYHEASKSRKFGSTIAITGILVGGAGVFLLNNPLKKRNQYPGNSNSLSESEALGLGLFMFGGALTNIGIPIWISKGIKAKNNKKAMDRQLRVSSEGSGIKLSYHF